MPNKRDGCAAAHGGRISSTWSKSGQEWRAAKEGGKGRIVEIEEDMNNSAAYDWDVAVGQSAGAYE